MTDISVWFPHLYLFPIRRKRQEDLRKADELKRMQREQRRKEKHLQKLRQKETDEISLKILVEERKLMETQRKLESIRLLDALFERIKVRLRWRSLSNV